jgi:hypothetical protein
VVYNSRKIERKREVQQGRAVTEFLMKMDVKIKFLDVLSEVQKDSKDVSAGIGIFV